MSIKTKNDVSAQNDNPNTTHRVGRIRVGNVFLTEFNNYTKSARQGVREQYVRDNINKMFLRLVCWDEQQGRQIIETDKGGHPFSLLNDLMTTAKQRKWDYERSGIKSYMLMYATDEEAQNDGINSDNVFAYHITNIADDELLRYNKSTFEEDVDAIIKRVMRMKRSVAANLINDAIRNILKAKNERKNYTVAKYFADALMQNAKDMKARLPENGYISYDLEQEVRELCNQLTYEFCKKGMEFFNREYAEGRIIVAHIHAC